MNILVNDDLFDDLADEPINDLYEMAKTIDSVESYGTFEKDWLKITNRKSLDNLKTYLSIYPELNNPPIKDARYPKLNQARKLRWNSKTNKASNTGDMRVINAYISGDNTIYLLLCYSKSKNEDLKPKQAKTLERIIQDLENNIKSNNGGN